MLGWLRLAAMLVFIAGFYFYWGNWWILFAISAFSLSFFLWLVSLALNTGEKISHLEALIKLLKEECNILNGHYQHRPDGTLFMPNIEQSGNDLDFFGPGSLFQFINRANTEQGQVLLADSFTRQPNLAETLARQQAIKELSEMPGWRNELQAITAREGFTVDMENRLNNWIKETGSEFSGIIWKLLRWLVPVFSFTITAIYIAGLISDQLFNTILILTLAFVYSFYKKIGRQYIQLEKMAGPLQAVSKAFACIEQASFKSGFLQELQQNLVQEQTASTHIAELRGILQRFDYRLNPVVHLPLSAYLFWDLQQVFALIKWKKKQAQALSGWFETLGNFEMLASYGTLSFNNPTWAYPEITRNWFEFAGKNLGHPLIRPEKMVPNNLVMQGTPHIILLTGSNMAGKSTFLRTIGVNMVLAMAGAPVNAKFLKLPLVKVICSMRITDNLQEETSTFYAELKKVKRIVDAVGNGERVFVLIDEMLRGTNAIDRHTGSVALIRQLIRQNAVAIIASHDLALAELEQEFPGIIQNYHFDSSILNEEIVFDYKLKEGVCQSNNATLLMKKVGIQI